MNIAIVGAGRIGSTFAFHLSRGGHDVTLIARGARLEELRRDQAIVSVKGARARVSAADALDPAVAHDLVLVTVLAHQVEVVLPRLKGSAAGAVMFMFNSFEPVDRLRDAVGTERAVFAFPTMTAFFVDGKLKSQVRGPGLNTAVDSAHWAAVFEQAGLPAVVEPDMTGFLRSHVAFIVPMMAAGCLAAGRATALSLTEAAMFTGALKEGLGVVRALGHPLKPQMVAALGWLPGFLLTFVFWAFSRTASARDLGRLGPGEVRQLIDAMAAAAPGKTPRLLAVRP